LDFWLVEFLPLFRKQTGWRFFFGNLFKKLGGFEIPTKRDHRALRSLKSPFRVSGSLYAPKGAAARLDPWFSAISGRR
jgi:hypothetical protein